MNVSTGTYSCAANDTSDPVGTSWGIRENQRCVTKGFIRKRPRGRRTFKWREREKESQGNRPGRYIALSSTTARRSRNIITVSSLRPCSGMPFPYSLALGAGSANALYMRCYYTLDAVASFNVRSISPLASLIRLASTRCWCFPLERGEEQKFTPSSLSKRFPRSVRLSFSLFAPT